MIQSTVYASNIWNPAGNTDTGFFERSCLFTSSDWVTYGLIAASNVYKQEPFRFRTFDDRKKEISFLVLNDIHGRSDYMKSLCREVDFKSLDFVLLNGDMSSWVEGQEQICKDYIDACVELFASEVPIVFNRGNHETRGVYSDALIKYFPTSTGTFIIVST